jgi:mono/diheme cytochrome c family protein
MHRALPWLLLLVTVTGCEQGMHDMYAQPRFRPMEPDPLFADGTSARTPPPGTVVARSGPLAVTSSARAGEIPPPDTAPVVMPLLKEPPSDGPVPTDLPIPVDAALLSRGRARFDIYCSPCHGYDGRGDGMVARRGFPAPPSYHTPRLRQAPSLHFYAVITHGYGAMYSYAARVTPADRWAIIAYIRALQLSAHAPIDALTDEERRRLTAPSSTGASR